MRIAKELIVLVLANLLCRTFSRSSPILLLYLSFTDFVIQYHKDTVDPNLNLVPMHWTKVALSQGRGEAVGKEEQWEKGRGTQGRKERPSNTWKEKNPFFLLCVSSLVSFSHWSSPPSSHPGSGIKWSAVLCVAVALNWNWVQTWLFHF